MIPEQPSFSDPLLSEFQRILVQKGPTSWSALLGRLADELAHARQRKQTRVDFSQREDPVKVSINRVLREHQVQLHWEKIAYLGCSAGGDVSLRTLFSYIAYPHIPIIIAMHHNPGFRFLAKLNMANGIAQQPIIVEHDMSIKSGELYFVPGDQLIGYHANDRSFQLSPPPSKRRFRPLIDQVFSVAGQRFHRQAIGVIMSGMLNDGAAGLKDMFLNHSDVLIQEPMTALFDDMPKAALEAVPTAEVLSLKGIADRINACSRQFLIPRSYKTIFAAGGLRD